MVYNKLCMSGGYLQCNTVVYIIKILTSVCAEYHTVVSFKKMVEHVGHGIVGLSM